MTTAPSPSPLATQIAPPAISGAAAPAAVPPTPNATSATVQPAAAPLAEPLPVLGALTASEQADDATLNYARSLGIAGDLGLPADASQPSTLNSQLAGETPEAKLARIDAEAAELRKQLAPPPPPANETPAEKLARLDAERAELRKTLNLAPEGTSPAAGAAAPAVPAAPIFTPTPDDPLVNVRSAEQLDLTTQAASELKAWAIKNRDGGTLPLHLAQMVEDAEAAREGRAPKKVTTALEISDADAGAIHAAAEQMLDLHLPKRRQVLGAQGQALGIIRAEAPQFLDPSKEEGKLFQQVAAQYPMLAGLPEWPLLARDLVTGFMANRPKGSASQPSTLNSQPPQAQTPALTVLAAPTVDANGKPVQVAPGAAIGGLSPSGPPISQAKIDAAQARLEAGTFSDEDLAVLGAAAV